MLVITTLKGLAVEVDQRGRGVGAAPVKRRVQLYEQSGFHLMYGQFTAERDLEPFYRRQHFTVLDLGESLRLEPLLALPASFASEGEERFCSFGVSPIRSAEQPSASYGSARSPA